MMIRPSLIMASILFILSCNENPKILKSNVDQCYQLMHQNSGILFNEKKRQINSVQYLINSEQAINDQESLIIGMPIENTSVENKFGLYRVNNNTYEYQGSEGTGFFIKNGSDILIVQVDMFAQHQRRTTIYEYKPKRGYTFITEINGMAINYNSNDSDVYILGSEMLKKWCFSYKDGEFVKIWLN